MSATPNRASNPAGGKSRAAKDTPVDLPTARRMLPLVRGIVADVTAACVTKDRLTAEQDALDRKRLSLDWAGRQRRYAVGDELSAADKALAAAVAELAALGVKVTDPATGAVDFPARINGRAAAYSWKPGEPAVGFWHYAGEDHRRPVPSDVQTAGRGRGD